MVKTIAVMGSTGSIGRQTLDVVKANPEKVKIAALAANTNDELLEQQIVAFNPDIAGVADGCCHSGYKGSSGKLNGIVLRPCQIKNHLLHFLGEYVKRNSRSGYARSLRA